VALAPLVAVAMLDGDETPSHCCAASRRGIAVRPSPEPDGYAGCGRKPTIM